LTHVDSYNNFKTDLSKLDKLYPTLDVINEATWLSRHNYSDFQMLWEITKYIAKKLKKDTYEKEWAEVFKALDYKGFVDRSGKGLIHGNEPYQAFIFNITDATTVKVVDNQ
jgi:hypothetical protein